MNNGYLITKEKSNGEEMPNKINPNYQPSQRVYELLKAYGVQNPVEYVGHELPAFMMYWEGTGKAKCNWDSTCLTWMKRTHEDKKHAMAQNRTYSGQQGNVFEAVLDNLKPPSTLKKEPDNFKPVRHFEYKRPEIEIDPTKTTEDYLNELARMTK